MTSAALQRGAQADVTRRMSPPARQSVARISEETGIHICTLYAWRKGWRLECEVVPASQKDPEGWDAGSGGEHRRSALWGAVAALSWGLSTG